MGFFAPLGPCLIILLKGVSDPSAANAFARPVAWNENMNIELEARRFLRFSHPRTFAVGAAFFLFLFHRLGLNPAADLFEWLLVVLPAVELSGFAALGAFIADGGGEEPRWTAFVGALRWFGFVVAANWVLAIFVASSLDAYVKLGGPPVVMLPV